MGGMTRYIFAVLDALLMVFLVIPLAVMLLAFVWLNETER